MAVDQATSLVLPLIFLLSISYGFSYFIVKKLIPKGLLRVVALLPVFYILDLAPWCFPSSVFLRGFTSFFLSWISSFKLLLFAFDRGDLIVCRSFAEFTAVAALPLKIKPNTSPISKPKPPFLQVIRTIQKLLLIVLPFSLISFQFATCLIIFAILVGYLGGISILHLEVVPVLNQIHRATSLKIFWGKRWNRISSDILRHTIYEPTLEHLRGFIGTDLGKVVALVTTLVVSGIMHEIMFYHMTCGMKPTWEVTRFFVLQGLCMALEAAIRRFWVQTLGQPPLRPIITVPLTLCFLLVTSYWLLILPVWRITGRGCNSQGYVWSSLIGSIPSIFEGRV